MEIAVADQTADSNVSFVKWDIQSKYSLRFLYTLTFQNFIVEHIYT